MRARGAICFAVVVVAATASAAPRAPDGWTEDRALAASIRARGGLEVSAFRAPGGASATYVVVRDDNAKGSPQTAADAAAAAIVPAGGTHMFDDHHVADGQAFAEVVAETPDGSHVHVKTTAGLVDDPTRVVVLAGVCSGHDAAAFLACEGELPLISIPVDSRYAPHSYSHLYRMIAIFVAALVALGLAAAWLRRARRRRDLLSSAPLADGELVTISGTVRAVDATLRAPLSGKTCVVYRTHARVFSRESVPRLLAEPVELATAPFVIETPRGVVRVDAKELAVALTPDAAYDVAADRVLAFFAKHGISAEQREGATFDEIALAPGQTVTMRGMIRVQRDHASTAERGYRDDAPVLVELVPANDEAVTIVRAW